MNGDVMAHYAQVNAEGLVVQVVVMSNDLETNKGEQACIDWLSENLSSDDWIKTSYNGNIRKQFAGIGCTYDSAKDKFILPQSFTSWSLDSNDDWQPPTARPDDGKMYGWNEGGLEWAILV